ncbi:MAG TPA: zf-HC2 domain-containing protein [Candidatus Ozemobacteraceae bacterium]|nr:zf-HC2 domain-containing protein [Candidatus Ozemobacteraceae bacterium]HQG28728.1 zf-HC2 domain-containing protein [Candidatus Ozemobacteraceae bacterium]
MNCPSTATITAFRRGTLGAAETRKLERHLQSCPSCANLARLAIPQCPEETRRRAETTARLLAAPRPETLAVGQLWSLVVPGADPEFGVLTGDERGSLDPKRPDIRVSFVTVEPRPENLSPDDVVGKAADSPLERPILVEYWNEWPVAASRLAHCFGEISAPLRKSLLNRLAGAANAASAAVSPLVRIFRDSRIRKASIFLTETLATALADDAAGPLEAVYEISPPANERLPMSGTDAPGPLEDVYEISPANERLLMTAKDAPGKVEHPLVGRLLGDLRKKTPTVARFRRSAGGIRFTTRRKGEEFSLTMLDARGKVLLRRDSRNGVLDLVPGGDGWEEALKAEKTLKRLKITPR